MPLFFFGAGLLGCAALCVAMHHFLWGRGEDGTKQQDPPQVGVRISR